MWSADRLFHNKIVHHKSSADILDSRTDIGESHSLVPCNGSGIVLVDREPDRRDVTLPADIFHKSESFFTQPKTPQLFSDVNLAEQELRFTGIGHDAYIACAMPMIKNRVIFVLLRNLMRYCAYALEFLEHVIHLFTPDNREVMLLPNLMGKTGDFRDIFF